MFSSVSGLRAHQSKMDVIGNNIANVNTVAFKSSRVTFQEVFSQTLKNAGAASDNRGGTNPMQVGLGISVAAVDSIQTRGSLQRTDNLNDLAINGEGFFIIRNPQGSDYLFTRAGNFGLDEFGNLITSDGYMVCGWQEFKAGSTTEFDTDANVGPINIYQGKKMISAKATTQAIFEGNLNAGTTSLNQIKQAGTTTVTFKGALSDVATGVTTPFDITNGTLNMKDILDNISGSGADEVTQTFQVYDKSGNATTFHITFVKNQTTGDGTEWFWYAVDDATQTAIGKFLADPSDPDGIDPSIVIADQGTITFGSNGKVISVKSLSDQQPDKELNAVLSEMDALKDSKTVLNLDFSKLTQSTAGASTVQVIHVDGQPDSTYLPLGYEIDETSTLDNPVLVKSSTGETMKTILDRKNVAEYFVLPYTMYDNQGNSTTVNVVFIKNQVIKDPSGKNPDETEWFWYAIDTRQQQQIDTWYKNHTEPIPANPDPNELSTYSVIPDQGTIRFDANGKIIAVEPASTQTPEARFATDITKVPKFDGAEAVVTTLDFSNITQYTAKSSVKAVNVNGNKPGTLVSYTIGEDGVIMGTYSNGEQRALAQIALAYFDNPAGLERVGSNLYTQTMNSGTFNGRGSIPGTGNVGSLSAGMLEMSNVDISQEFVEMITTQRGFQANSRVITTTDEMLQELVNLKR